MDFGTDVYYDHYFKLQFHGFSFGSSCSISSVVAEFSTSNTPGSGTNNTLDFDSKTCSSNYIEFAWWTDRIWADNWGRLGLSSGPNGLWTTSQYIILYIIVAPSAQDLPVMHHDYIFMSGTYNYNRFGSNDNRIRNTAYLPIQTLASSASVTTLTTSR
jgi:hypothetical protein